jgi:hypothetical protein
MARSIGSNSGGANTVLAGNGDRLRNRPAQCAREEMMTQVAAEACTAVGAVQEQFEPYPVREVTVGPIRVQRALPLRGRRLPPGILYYLGTQRADLSFASADGARVLLIGGLPFGETILMWWNFVARTPEEIRTARDDWEAHRRFGEVPAFQGPRLAAPELTRLAHPNPVS